MVLVSDDVDWSVGTDAGVVGYDYDASGGEIVVYEYVAVGDWVE